MLDIDSLAFPSTEQGKLFLIHDSNLSDDNHALAPVIDIARRAGLSVSSDLSRENEDLPSGVERVRWFA